MESKLTDRDVVAMHALQGLLARPTKADSPVAGEIKEGAIQAAFQYADLFLQRSADDRDATGMVGTA